MICQLLESFEKAYVPARNEANFMRAINKKMPAKWQALSKN
jgi:hypothetical protein